MLWLGFEFFRGELYYLRFTWLNVGYAFSDKPLLLATLGVYGIGFVLMAVACATGLLPARFHKSSFLVALFVGGLVTNLPSLKSSFARASTRELRVAGVQMEFPSENQVVVALEKLRKQLPDADLFVLSEYTFDGAVPERLKAWCGKHQKHLIAGGKKGIAGAQFYNTAFVVGTNGDIVFEQAKSVPIQFFKDGLPAKEQRVWDSPWGKLGLCICYDLSYTRVTDRLIKAGAQALIVPTMDVEQWGEHEHQLHSRIAPTRAAEYGLPIFRVASSGISQLVSGDGIVRASAAFAVDEATLSGVLALPARGRVPLDRFVAWIAVIITGITVLAFAFAGIWRWINRRSTPKAQPPSTPAPFSV